MTEQNLRKIALSQIVAVSARNVLSMVIGMTVGYATILIPGLSSNDENEMFQLNEEKVSWLGSTVPISSLIGSIFSSVISQPLGRKRAMMILSIPFLLLGVIYYFAKNLWHIYCALALSGLTVGLLEAPVLTYVAEITEPHLRGILSATGPLTVVFGVLFEFFLGTVLEWRNVGLVLCIVSLTALCVLCLVPESPYWLLSNNRHTDARKSLAWLRGWTTVDNIEQEFQQIQDYCNHRSNGTDNSVSNDAISSVEKTKSIRTAFADSITFDRYTKKGFLWPFSLIAFLYFLANFTGALTLQTYAVVIFSTLQVPLDKYYATVLMGSAEFLGSLICIFFVRRCGKRVMALVSLSGVGICNILLSIYAIANSIEHLDFDNLTNSSNSFDGGYKWIPLVILVFLSFLSHCGVKALPWILIGEVFSYDTRAMGCGLATAVFYLTGFFTNRVYINMVSVLSFPGVYGVHASLSALGIIIIWFGLPETEGKTLQEIVNHFYGRLKLDNYVKQKNRIEPIILES